MWVLSRFEGEYPVIQNRFLKFGSLRPKWCVIAGTSGTHSICICLIKQNVKLLVGTFPNNTSCKALLKLILCDDKN